MKKSQFEKCQLTQSVGGNFLGKENKTFNGNISIYLDVN